MLTKILTHMRANKRSNILLLFIGSCLVSFSALSEDRAQAQTIDTRSGFQLKLIKPGLLEVGSTGKNCQPIKREKYLLGNSRLGFQWQSSSCDPLKNIRALFEREGMTISAAIDQPDTQNLGGLIHALDRANGRNKHRRYDINSEAYPVQSPPGLLSRRGFTILLKDQQRLWHFDSKHAQNLFHKKQLLDDDRKLYVFVYGDNYKQALANFVSVNGRIPMLPKWSLGTWFSRYQPYDEQDYKDIIKGFRERHIPLDVIVPDMNWHKDNWFSTEYNTDRFPEMKAFLKWCHDNQIHVGFNHHPGAVPVDDKRALPFLKAIGMTKEQALAETEKVLKWGWDDAKGTYYFGEDNVDYLNVYFKTFIDPIMADGVDFNWVDGSPSQPVLAAYYQFTERANQRRAIVLTRMVAGSFEMHRYPLAFSGDTYISWDSLAFTLMQSNQAANQGVTWSHDIGGHMAITDDANKELFARWIQMGAMQTITRLHATGGTEWDNRLIHDRRIWSWGEKVTESARRILQLKNQLTPYLYTLQRAAFDTGILPTRPLYFNYPQYQNAYRFADTQYLLGDNLLIAPILNPAQDGKSLDGIAHRDVWLPPGEWYDWFSGQKYQGNQVVVIAKNINEMPIFARAGSVIPLKQPSASAMDRFSSLQLKVFPAEGKNQYSTHIYLDDGQTLTYKDGNHLQVIYQVTLGDKQPKVAAQTKSGRKAAKYRLPNSVSVQVVQP